MKWSERAAVRERHRRSRRWPAGAAGIIILSDRDTTVIAAVAGQAGRVQVSRDEAAARTGGIPLVVEVPQAAIIARFPQAQGVFDQLNAAGEMTVLPMGGWEATVMAVDTVLGTATAPNVVGILEGTDPILKHEYVVFSAHMDHIGISAGQARQHQQRRGRRRLRHGRRRRTGRGVHAGSAPPPSGRSSS